MSSGQTQQYGQHTGELRQQTTLPFHDSGHGDSRMNSKELPHDQRFPKDSGYDASDVEDEDWEEYSPQKTTHSWWKTPLYLVLLIITVCGLSIVPLSLTPSGEHGHGHGHGHNGAPTDGLEMDDHVDDSEQHGHGHGHNDQSPEPLQYKEDIPSSPTVRASSDYLLDMGWDLDAQPVIREYYWTILDAELNPDGVYRPMILINNQFPGPLIECNEGDTIIVHVDNQAVNSTSIHFHGLFQNGTNAMDGTVGVTQCPIAPGSTFTYTFDIQGQSGTYWYHAHHSAQASDGMLGPVIVHTSDERKTLQELEYATDRVIMIQDHYHNLTSEILMEYLAPDMENDEPVPDNALINGRGSRDCDDFPGWRCDNSNTSTTILDLATNKKHRLRIINVGAFAEFQIQFDEHEFHVTEVDGTDVHPEPFHRLNISPAQRYSVVLTTNNTSAASYWMRARMVTHCFATKNRYLEPEIRGIIRYVSEDVAAEPSTEDPQSKDWPESIEVICRDLNTTLLKPTLPQTLPDSTDILILDAKFQIGAWRLARGFFNDSTWHANITSPSLHRYLSAPKNLTTTASGLATNDLVFDPDTELVFQTTGVMTVDIVINNFDDGAHPFHLHGHKFFVLINTHDDVPPPPAELPDYLSKHGNLDNPLRRDTVTIEGYGWAVLRVTLDNPGLWTFHCHNTWHAESGMVLQMLVRGEVVKGWDLGEEAKAMCKKPGVERGMRPDDSIWFGSL